jgi:hypothetical protein
MPLKIIWMEDLPFRPDGRYSVFHILAVPTLEPLYEKGSSGASPDDFHMFSSSSSCDLISIG